MSPRVRLLLVVTGVLAASCTGAAAYSVLAPPSGNPDPSNLSLHTLAAEPIFTQLPVDAVRIGWQENPAEHRGSAFEGYVWDGPTVKVTFTSSQSVTEVYHFYAERAQHDGWTPVPGKVQSGGLIWCWSKPIAGKAAFIMLYEDFQVYSVDIKQSGVPRTYRLSGSV